MSSFKQPGVACHLLREGEWSRPTLRLLQCRSEDLGRNHRRRRHHRPLPCHSIAQARGDSSAGRTRRTRPRGLPRRWRHAGRLLAGDTSRLCNRSRRPVRACIRDSRMKLRSNPARKSTCGTHGTLVIPPPEHVHERPGFTMAELLPAPLAELEPELVAQPAFYLKERSVDPRALSSAAIKAAKHVGVDFSSGDPVNAVDLSDGRVTGVTTTKTSFLAPQSRQLRRRLVGTDCAAFVSNSSGQRPDAVPCDALANLAQARDPLAQGVPDPAQ